METQPVDNTVLLCSLKTVWLIVVQFTSFHCNLNEFVSVKKNLRHMNNFLKFRSGLMPVFALLLFVAHILCAVWFDMILFWVKCIWLNKSESMFVLIFFLSGQCEKLSVCKSRGRKQLVYFNLVYWIDYRKP